MKRWFLNLGICESLAGDFAWIVRCAASNAEYGYGVLELFNSNATVRDLMKYYGRPMQDVVIALGRIGWAICSEDYREVENNKQKFLELWKTRKESLKFS